MTTFVKWLVQVSRLTQARGLKHLATLVYQRSLVSRLTQARGLKQLRCFNPRACVRRDINNLLPDSGGTEFQSTRLREARPAASTVLGSCSIVSIHAPA